MGSLDFDTEKADFRGFYDSERDNLEAALRSFETLIESLLLLEPTISISSIDGRIKEREECLSKFTRKYRTELESSKTSYTIRERISDLIGLRVVCLYEDDIERIKGIVSDEFDVLDITDKISQIEGTEGSFGYKGLHLDLKLNSARREMAEYRLFSDLPFELQIRTIVQDSWSVIDHKIKYKKSIPNDLKRRINTLAALFELADREFCAIRDATVAELEHTEKIYPKIEEETESTKHETDSGTGSPMDVPRGQYAPLNAFNFLRIAQHFFPGFEFEPQKVDGFTNEIVSLMTDISRGKFNFYLREAIGDIKRYQEEFEAKGDTMNPYTIIRHCLYSGDATIFASMLTDTARKRFDAWQKRS